MIWDNKMFGLTEIKHVLFMRKMDQIGQNSKKSKNVIKKKKQLLLNLKMEIFLNTK